MRNMSALADGVPEFPFPSRFISHAADGPARPRHCQGIAPEIAFLAAFGIDPGILLKICQQAEAEGVTADAVLLGEGLVDESSFYRALARHCGVPYHDGPVQLVSSAQFPQAIHAGALEIVPLSGPRWLLAPRGKTITRLIAAARRNKTAVPDFAITTPARISHLVQLEFEAARLERASFELYRADPALSAYIPETYLKPFVLLGIFMTGIVLAALSPALSMLIVLACSVVFLLAIFVRLCAWLACFAGPDKAPAPLPDPDLPLYTLLVPLFDEACVLPDLVRALDQLDYPKSKLDIKLIVEARDFATRQAITALQLPPRYDMVVCPEGAPRTKPRALNMALPLARGALVVVFDAEDRPEPGQLREAAARFAATPDLACLQGQLVIDNIGDSWLTRLFAIEYAALFSVVDHGLCQLGLPLPLGGTSNHFRTRILRDICGWDAWNVTEDADLGLRLARLGYQVESFAAVTREEAPISLGAWLGQRQRWQKGWMQTLCTHLADPLRFVRELGLYRALLCAGTMLGMALGGLTGPVFALAFWRAALGERLLQPESLGEIAISTLALCLFTGGLAAGLGPLVLGMWRRGLWPFWPWLILLPLYYALGSYASWRGLIELCTRPFHWQKTQHGVSKRRATPMVGRAAGKLPV